MASDKRDKNENEEQQQQQQQQKHDCHPPSRPIATTYRELDNNDHWMPNRATCMARNFREISGPNNARTGSGIFYDGQEIPLPIDQRDSRKRQRVAPHVVQGMALLPPPMLYNASRDRGRSMSEPSPVTSAPNRGQGVHYGWISYVDADTNESGPADFSFGEAVVALRSLGNRVSSNGLHSNAAGESASNEKKKSASPRKRERGTSEESG